MSTRDGLFAMFGVMLGLALGIAVCPKQTGTPLDRVPDYVSTFSKMPDGATVTHHSFYGDLGYPMGQAVLFDGRGRTAKVVGVEYYITEYTWKSLPEYQRPGWHPCQYSVAAGLTVTPDIRRPLPSEDWLRRRHGMYSKTVVVWHPGEQYPGDPVLTVPPQAEGDVDKLAILARDADLNINTAAIARERAVMFPVKKGGWR